MNLFPNYREKLDLFKEVVFVENQDQTLPDRFEMPIFFIVGGADDEYLSSLLNISKNRLIETIQSRSVDVVDKNGLTGVYVSRANLMNPEFKIRTFPLDIFLNLKWPILLDIRNPSSSSIYTPDNIQTTWIIRALRRHNLLDLAETVRSNMLKRIYPEKLSLDNGLNVTHNQLSINNLAEITLQLDSQQKNYPTVIIVDDLPIKLEKTLAQMLNEIVLTGCTTSQMAALKTSLQLLTLT